MFATIKAKDRREGYPSKNSIQHESKEVKQRPLMAIRAPHPLVGSEKEWKAGLGTERMSSHILMKTICCRYHYDSRLKTGRLDLLPSNKLLA